MSYDCLVPMKSEEWIREKVWMFNRTLFLLTLNSRQPDIYWHNDDPPVWSFNNELDLIRTKWPKLHDYASGVMADHYFETDIGFME